MRQKAEDTTKMFFASSTIFGMSLNRYNRMYALVNIRLIGFNDGDETELTANGMKASVSMQILITKITRRNRDGGHDAERIL